MKSSKRIEFDLPDHVIPEGTEEGEDFDMTCTFRSKGRNHVCLVMAGDVKMPGYDDKNGSEKRPTYDKYRRSMMSEDMGEGAMQETGGY